MWWLSVVFIVNKMYPCCLRGHWPWGSNHQLREGFCEGKKNNIDTMMTPVTASETYLWDNKTRRSLTEKDDLQGPQHVDSVEIFRFKKNNFVLIQACLSYPFLKNTDQPGTNLGSLVNRRTANNTKKKEIAPSAKLKFSVEKSTSQWEHCDKTYSFTACCMRFEDIHESSL